MARILGQLQCRRCGVRFWPERGESAALVLFCPRCSAAHANPDALPSGPLRTSNRVVNEWLRTYWIDAARPRPQVLGAPRRPPTTGLFRRSPGWISVGALESIARCWTMEVEGFPTAVVRCAYLHRHGKYIYSSEVWTTVLVAAYLPRADLLSDIEGAWIGRGGLAFVDPGNDCMGQAHAIARELARRGAEPLFGLAEVPDPTPLDAEREARELDVRQDEGADARIESQRVRCAHCGAPSSVAALIGEDARCPYCTAPQGIEGALAAELATYRRRVHAAQLRPRTMLSLSSAWAQPLARSAGVGPPTIACAHCGALNAHVASIIDASCTRCRAPVVPSNRAMRAAAESEAENASRAHGRHAMREAALQFKGFRTDALITQLTFDNIIALVSLVLSAYVFFMATAYVPAALSDGSGLAGLALTSSVGLVIALFGLTCGYLGRRRRRRAVARWLLPVGALARQLGATRGPAEELFSWGKRWWNDRLAPAWHSTSAHRVVLTFQSVGFPVAITLDPKGSIGFTGHASPHADIALAAELPRDVAYWVRQPAARKILGDLAHVGYALDLRTGGLALFASSGLVKQFAESPERLAFLAPIIAALTQLAHLLRAEPPRTPEATTARGAHGAASRPVPRS